MVSWLFVEGGNAFKKVSANVPCRIRSVSADNVSRKPPACACRQEEITNQLNILIAGVDDNGGHIFSVLNGDTQCLDRIGYHAIGSETQPARSPFIRNRYDTSCEIEEALLSVVEAKMQAEEAQGVECCVDVVPLLPLNSVEALRHERVEIARHRGRT